MAGSLFGLIAVVFLHGLVLIKLWGLWEGQTSVVLVTILVYVVIEGAALVSVIIALQEGLSGIQFNQGLHMCVTTHKPIMFKIVWVCTLIFDTFMVAMLCLNALSRPRHSHTFMMRVLYRDGLFCFLAIVALALLNLVISITAPASRLFLGVFCILALVTTIVCRMIINLQEAENEGCLVLTI